MTPRRIVTVTLARFNSSYLLACFLLERSVFGLRNTEVPLADKTPIQQMALGGLHESIVRSIKQHVPVEGGANVLDLGAGSGALSQKLDAAGYRVDACDMFPELFQCQGIECRKADVHEPLPYESDRFDSVVAVEVVEHLESHLGLFEEVQRILKPGGSFIFSTPNISSLKSRFRFLLTGYFYSHGPLDPTVHDPVSQHIAAFTPDRYQFILARSGLELKTVETDKFQSTSMWLSGLSPIIRFLCNRKFGKSKGTEMQNSPASLLGRAMIGIATKPSQAEMKKAG